MQCRHSDQLLTPRSIYYPTAGPPPTHGPSTVVLLLPRGPLLNHPESDIANASYLRSTLPYTVAQINYRLGRDNPYPTPVHDVLAGYDWAVEHLLPKRSITRAGRSEHVGRVCVLGELLGGSLATMLALTECRKGQPGVVTAAVNSPLIDWIQPEDIDLRAPRSSLAKHGQSHSGLSIDDFLRARGYYFPKPEAYFDPFASPILFFRSPGAEVPVSTRSELDELELLSNIEREDFHRQQQLLSGIGNLSMLQDIASGNSSEEGAEASKSNPRKASRQFPSKSLNLSLPSLHVSTGNASPLADQAVELAGAMRKSIARQFRATSGRRNGFRQKVLMDHEEEQMDEQQRLERLAEEAEANDKVSFGWNEGLGLWDQSPAGRKGLETATAWVREQLR